jgi:hypothetical protein
LKALTVDRIAALMKLRATLLELKQALSPQQDPRDDGQKATARRVG